ncbi:MAG: arginine--tRNA ligase [Rhodocyclaceae bacterium]|nr:arginine--tRNA ligase [Rhodocyclaceae bacterium]
MADDLKSAVSAALRQALASVAPDCTDVPIVLERPKQSAHGDFASNIAMQIARALRQNPRDIAQRLVRELPAGGVIERAEVAGAGFINLFLTAAAKCAVVRAVLTAGDDYGRGRAADACRVQVEFVSANPTGPLHVGHGRGAAYGASLANVLQFAGFTVGREYYVNDAGRQMDILALSTWLRYLALFGIELPFPPNAYQGDYVIAMARTIRDCHGERYVKGASAAALLAGLPAGEDAEEARLDALIAGAKRVLGEDYAYVHQHALAEQLGDCREDLAEFGVHFDNWFSERSLYDTGMVEKAVATLERRGHLYLQDGALWFRSTAFGDEKDRVVRRENGQYTYFASDIAYHANKFERGFERVIDIWGADHHGYIARVKGALTALGLDPARLHIALVQFAVLYRNGQKVGMSTRAGQFVTLRELRGEVGNDAARLFYVLRKSDQHLDFDLDLAKSQSNENPVYYIQYAHARVCSVLREWGGEADELAGADLAPLAGPRELALAARLADFRATVLDAATDYAPHVIAFYLKDLAAEFHSFYNAERILVDAPELRLARLALCRAVGQVIANGLRLLGVSAPQTM